MAMQLKVCGMRQPENIQKLLEVGVDYLGMIFYAKSKRYVQEVPLVDFQEVIKVGVFVNADFDFIKQRIENFGLGAVQLHGEETVELAKSLQDSGVKVIKAFGVMDHLPVTEMKPFEEVVDYFLFDTKTPEYGGSGQKFDWSILAQYPFDKPFFLSGGIDLDDIEVIQKLNIPQLAAIDVNSRFELEPGLKNIEKIKELKQKL